MEFMVNVANRYLEMRLFAICLMIGVAAIATASASQKSKEFKIVAFITTILTFVYLYIPSDIWKTVPDLLCLHHLLYIICCIYFWFNMDNKNNSF